MLYGVDISNFQPVSATKYSGYAFVIVKATEGVTFNDKSFQRHIGNAMQAGQLVGAYHYARPEYNTAAAEARHFLEVFRPYIGKAVPALDWEQRALKYPVWWALEWLRIVEAETGCKPLFYVQQSQACMSKYRLISNAGYPLWLAQYAGKHGSTVWDKVTIWQYTSSPLDRNVFYGDKADWMQMIRPGEPAEQERKVKIVGITKKGMSGVQVKGLQTMLAGYGYYSATIDGSFGPKTEEAVKAFQKAEGLDVDGLVGEKTWSRLAGLE